MRKKRYDIVVVGCGPGGAIAGKFAALNGAETLVIEEKRQIGFPVYDSMGIVYSQQDMEEITGDKIEPAIIYAKAKGLAYISPAGKEGKPQLLEDGIFINRQLFEKSLAISAARAGAEIILHTRVVGLVREQGIVKGIVIRDGSGVATIPCSVVIGADGAYQFVARLAGMKLSQAPISVKLGCEFVQVKSPGGLPNIDEIYLDPSGEGAYGTVIPYTEDRVVAGLACYPSRAKQKKSLKQRLDDFLRHLEQIGRYDFSKASPVSMIVGGQAMAAVPRLASDGLILIGSAAGAPLFGSRWGGTGLMAGACWTGRVAGQIAAEAVRKGDVCAESLEGKYKGIIDDTLKGVRTHILEALRVFNEIRSLSPQEQDRAIEEVGQEVAALHFYSKGCLASPLPSCLEPAQHWLREGRR